MKYLILALFVISCTKEPAVQAQQIGPVHYDTTPGNMRINLYVMDPTGPILLDGVMTMYSNQWSNLVDFDDVFKFMNPGANISIEREGWHLTAERRQCIRETDTTFVRIAVPRTGDYQLKFVSGISRVGNLNGTSIPRDTTFYNLHITDSVHLKIIY